MHIIKIDYRNTFSRGLQGPLYRMVRDTFRVKGTLESHQLRSNAFA